MTLLEILVKELPSLGGWPVDSDDERTLSASFPNAMWGLNSGDYYAFAGPGEAVTREQYEAALSASKKPEWNGDGLPPVGCECERKWKGQPDTHWSKIKVLWVNHEKMLIEYIGEHYKNHVQLINLQSTDFRPLRSEADRKRDEAVIALIDFDIERKTSSIQELYPALYDAIAAGKIPGIRIE